MSNHLPREGREQRMLNRVRAILEGGGRCLLPVVALGRAQVGSLQPLFSLFEASAAPASTACDSLQEFLHLQPVYVRTLSF